MSNPSEAEKIPCDVCRKELPLSEAMIPEAEEYIAHFCDLECYEKWKQESGQNRKRTIGNVFPIIPVD